MSYVYLVYFINKAYEHEVYKIFKRKGDANKFRATSDPDFYNNSYIKDMEVSNG